MSNELLANEPLIIVGGGLAGSLAALAIAARRPDVPLLLVEAGAAFGGNHTWSFFDGDVTGDGRALVDEMQPIHWSSHSIRFPKPQPDISASAITVSIRATDSMRLVRKRLSPSQYRTSDHRQRPVARPRGRTWRTEARSPHPA